MDAQLNQRLNDAVLQDWLGERFGLGLEAAQQETEEGPFGTRLDVESLSVPMGVWAEHLSALVARQPGLEAVSSYAWGYTHFLVDGQGWWDVSFNEETRRVQGPARWVRTLSATASLPEVLDFHSKRLRTP